ncbi:putative dash complex subunit [Phaeomoniella chlamydospora]|uniref:DASH complex subunit DAD2 n=1 Tax=Phaeomoniella chlamydospora TaxID=158046 RepID=A0A0G2GK38_PHACM|nr:putative dash complex subunit [Phaeomoniella chlamydospora]
MSCAPRPTAVFPSGAGTASSLRQPSLGSHSTQQAAALQARIESKKAELENLKQLRDLSGTLATQMSQLEAKLATLRDGTEAVATVMANWDHVLKAISLASVKTAKVAETNGSVAAREEDKAKEADLPATLIRIPVQDAESAARATQTQTEQTTAESGD